MKRAVLAVLLLAATIALLWRWKSPTIPADAGRAREVLGNAGKGNANLVPAAASQAPVAAELARLTYAQKWTGAQPAELAAFRDWVETYRRAGTATARAALEPTGLALARARRPIMHRLMERDPETAFAMTVPAGVRAALPGPIAAELEARFSSRADFTVLAFDYDAAEIARRRALNLSTDPFQYTLTLDGREYPAFVYGRRTGQTSKRGIPVHGLTLDGIVALHPGALRVLEPGEVATSAAGTIAVELAGRVLEYGTSAEILRDEAKLEGAEVKLGPVPVASNLAGVGSTSSTEPDISTAAAPASAWTVGAKSVLVIRVDFSDLPGDPRRGSTIYTPAYVQNLADTAIKPYYAQSSFGQTSIATTVSSQVYRMPQTATSYATAGANTQLHTDARAAAGANFDVNSYDRIVVLFSTLGGISGSQITYGGLAEVGAKNVWVNGYFDFRVVAHELGHTYGLRHANLWQVTDGNPVSAAGTSTEYGDDFDTMGANFADDRRTDFNPWFKNLLGWAADSQVQTVTTNGTYRINRFDNSTGTGTLGLKLLRDATRNYWVGVRRNFTTNASMQHGAYIIWGYNSSTASDLLDTTTPGSSDTDAALAPGTTLLDTAGNLSIRTVAEGGTAPNEYLDVQVTFGLNGVPVFSTQPQSQGYNPGANVTLSAVVSGTAPLNYQWRKNGTDIPGAATDTLAINNAQALDAGSYTLRVSNAIGSVVSSPAVLAVFGGPRFLVEPSNVTAAAGQAVTLTAVVAGSPPPTYRWQKGGVDVPNATGSSLAFTSVQSGDAGSYTVVVTNSVSSVTSPPAVITVNAATTPPANDNFANAWNLTGNAGTALGSSSGATRETSEPSHFSAGGVTGTASVWFRWTPATSGTAIIDTVGSLFDTVLAVYTGSTLSGLTKLGEDDQSGGLNTSRLKLPVTAGTTYYIAVADFASTGLGGPVSLHYGIFIAPAITSQPASQVSSVGGTASFSVTASGTNPTYQWFRNGAALPGATDATLSLSNLQVSDGGIYFVTVANAAGSVVSNAVTLTSTAVAPTINSQPANVIVTSGQPASFTVAASGTGTLSYQWRRNGVPLTAATGATLTLPAATRAEMDYYDVVVTSGLTSTVSQRARVSVAPLAYPGLVSPDPDWELRPESSGGTVLASAPLADGRVYIGGTFVSLNGTRRTSIARVAADGTLDATFTPPEIDNGVRAIVVQPDGKVLIGGDFVRVNGFLRPRVARLNSDGSIDSSFDVGAGADATVASLALQADGKVLVGGSFIGFAGTTRDFLVRLTSAGAVDTGFLTLGMSSTVNALAVQTDGKIVVGGSFTTGYHDINGNTTSRSRMARLNADGTIDTGYNPGPNGTVNALALKSDGTVIVGGTFTSIGGATVGNIARVGTSGVVDTGFNSSAGTGFNSTVNALAIAGDGRILVGGTFTTFAGATANRFARLNTGGSRDTGLLTQGFTSTVNTVAVLSTGLLAVGGGFSNYQNSAGTSTARTRFARLNADGTLDTAVNFTFRTFGTISAALPLPGGKVLVAGLFTTIRGATVPSGLVQLNADTTVDVAFNPGGAGANSNIFSAIRQPDGKIVITGGFTTYNGATANGIARLNADGSLDASFTNNSGGLGGAGFTLQLLPGGRIFVAGAFGSAGGLPRNSVAVFNADGTADATFDPGSGTTGQIYTAAVQPDGKIIIGGSFATFNGATTPFIARLNPNGSVDSGFAIGTGPNSSVLSLGLQSDGKILAGGTFSTFAGSTRLGLARLATTGALDSTYVPLDVNSVYALLVQEDGRVIIRGSFVSVGGTSGTAFLSRLNSDATRDTSFAAGGFASASGVPSFLALDDAGRLLVPSSGAPGMTASESSALPTITQQPAARIVAPGSSVTLSVVAGSTLPLTYQWRLNGAAVPGAISSTLVIANAQGANTGAYTVVVANELGFVTSATANVTVTSNDTGTATPSIFTLSLSGDPAPDGIGTLGTLSSFAAADGVAAVAGPTFNSSGVTMGDILYTVTRQGLRIVARGGNSMPGGGSLAGIGSQFSMNSAGGVAFFGALSNTPQGSADNSGIFVGSDSSMVQIARAGQLEPGGPGTFNSFSGPTSINSSGQVAFGVSFGSGSTGVYMGSGSGLTTVARAGMSAPGGGTFATPIMAGINEAGQVFFTADLQNTAGGSADNFGVFRGDGTNIVQIARENDLVPGGNGRLSEIYGPYLVRGGAAALSTVLRETTGGTTDNRAIYRGAGGALTKIVRSGESAPGGDGQFNDFNNIASINVQGDVAFTAALRNATAGRGQGVFWSDGTTLHPIARSGDVTPEGGSTYTNFLSVVIADTRTVVFFAERSTGELQRGIYLSDGTETILASKVGDALAGNTVSSIGFDPKAVNGFGQVVFQGILANGRWGVFVFSPALKWRLNGDGSWDDPARWTVSLLPSEVARVEIDPAAGGRVTGPATATTVRSLKIGGTTAGTAELNLQLDSRLTVLEGAAISTKGKLTGSGTVVGNLTNGGVIEPGPSVGNLAIEGNYYQTAAGSLALQASGANPGDYDRITSTGAVQLSGILALDFINGFLPVSGTFDVVRGQSIQLNSAQIVGPAGYALTQAIVNGPEGQTLRLTLTSTGNVAAPTISHTSDQIIDEDTPTSALAFVIGDSQTPAASLTLSASSSNTTLVPNGNIVFGGSGGNRTVAVTPASNQSGTATITLTVSDGSRATSDSFVLTVNPVNDAPTISDITNQAINAGSSTAALAFTVADVDTALGSLVVTGSSSNQSLVPNANVVFGGSGGNRTVTVTPVAGQGGAATITVTISDGTLTASDTFVVTVNAPPTISDIPNQATNEDTATAAIALTVGDAETAAGSLTVSGSSSNTTLVPNANVVLGGSGANRTVTIIPAANESGTTTITVTVSDGQLTASDTFIVTVNPVNDPPTISDIGTQVIDWNTNTGTVAFVVGDIDTPVGSLTVTASSSNQALVPDANIVLGGSGGNRTVTVTPVANHAGSATITVTVSDGALSSSDTFLLVVQPAGLSATQQLDGGYIPGGTITVTNTFSFNQEISHLSWTVLLPPGFKFVSGVDAGTPSVSPTPDASDTLNWAWVNVPPSGSTFTYTLSVPADTAGVKELAALAEMTLVANGEVIQFVAKPDPLLIVPARHSADTNGNDKIDVSELSRVIALYNTRFTTPDGKIRTGAYSVATTTTADGFSPDAARDPDVPATLARYHSADTNHNGRIDVSELSRVIALYNTRFTTPDGKIRTGFYKLAPGTLPDGFAPDPTRAP